MRFLVFVTLAFAATAVKATNDIDGIQLRILTLRDKVRELYEENKQLLQSQEKILPRRSNEEKERNTELHQAVFNNNIELVKTLLENGAAIDAKNNAGDSPLALATLFNRPEIADLLLGKGANPSLLGNYGGTPLINAVASDYYNSKENERLNMLNLIIKHKKASVNDLYYDIYDSDNGTALHVAVEWGNIDVVKTLLEADANPNIQTSVSKSSPLHYAGFNDAVPIFKLLVQYGANTTLETNTKETPLDFLSTDERKEIDEFLAGEYEMFN